MGATSGLRQSTIQRAVAALVALATLATGAEAGGRRASAPAPVVSVTADGERIPTIRTGRGVTTMLSLPEEASEAICGDLYDAQTGNGGYVIQRSGRDIFLKPLRAAGGSNLFVKTEHETYAFELVVVPPPQAMRIVRVEPAPQRIDSERDRLERERAALDAARAAFDCERAETAAALERHRDELERDAGERAEARAREWVATSVRRGAAVLAVTRRAARGRDVELELGDALLAIGGRGYLSCTIRNRTQRPITIAAAQLSGGVRIRTALSEVVPPGTAAIVVLETDTVPGRDATLRLLDSSGSELVTLRPFR